MTNQEPGPSQAVGRHRRYLLAAALLALLVLGVTLLLTSRDTDQAPHTAPTTGPEPTIGPSTTTRLSTEVEVTTRLKEILQIRERAFKERDASLFDDVYTSDCSCLRAGREAIDALKKEHVQWRGRSISVEVQSTRSLNSRLWEVVALFISDPFRIETEQGTLVREAPAERLRYRFLLTRTSAEEPWRLGSASLVEGSG